MRFGLAHALVFLGRAVNVGTFIWHLLDSGMKVEPYFTKPDYKLLKGHPDVECCRKIEKK